MTILKQVKKVLNSTGEKVPQVLHNISSKGKTIVKGVALYSPLIGIGSIYIGSTFLLYILPFVLFGSTIALVFVAGGVLFHISDKLLCQYVPIVLNIQQERLPQVSQ